MYYLRGLVYTGSLRNWALLFFCLYAGMVFGADWISPTTPEDWNTAGNWSNPASPPTGQDGTANFNQASPPIPASPVVRIATTNTDIGTINIDSAPAQSYTFSQTGSGTLRFNVSSSNASVNVTNSLGNGAHTFSVPISLSSPLTVTQDSTGTLTFSGAVSGSESLTKAGSGTLSLTAANSYSKDTVINAGKLSVNQDNRLGSTSNTTVTINGATLEFTANTSSSRTFHLTGSANIDVDAGASVSLGGLIRGTGSLTKTDSGTLVLTTTNSYEGGTTIASGTLSIASTSNLGNLSGSLNFGNGNLTLTAPLSIARSGAVTGNSSITSTFSNSFTGNFSGAGSLTFQGGGIFTLTGTNSYSGGTTLAAATTLIGTTQSLQGNITTSAGSSSLLFNQSSDGTYSGVLSGAGSLQKLGSGTVFLSGSSPGFSGATTVSAGSLIVDGDLSNSAVDVQTNGRLGGLGTVGTTSVSGDLSPGSGSNLGTLHINGDLTLNATARTQMEIAPLQTDAVSSSGNAAITGPLLIRPTPGFYGFSANYTLLSSSNLSGTFSSVTSTIIPFVPSLSYTATDVLLSLDILEPFAAFPFSNINTEAVGNNIDAIYAANQLSSDLRSVFNEFVGQDISLINAALDQMHPAPYSTYIEAQTEAGSQLLSLFQKSPSLPCSCSLSSRFWMEGYGNSLTLKDYGIQLGFQSNAGGIALGCDRQISDSLSLGLGGAWMQNHVNWKAGRGNGKINGFYGGIYVDNRLENFCIGASFLGGVDFYETSRDLRFFSTSRKAISSHDSIDLMGQLRLSYLFGAPQAFFYPYAHFDYLHILTNSFQESGADGLNLLVRERSDGTFRTEMGLGFQVEDRNPDETICISPKVSIGWVNMSPVLREPFKASFQGTSILFSTFGWDESWNLFNVNFALSLRLICFDLSLDYNVEISPDSKTTFFNQNGHLLLGWKW